MSFDYPPDNVSQLQLSNCGGSSELKWTPVLIIGGALAPRETTQSIVGQSC
jgi:hypothetical protein